MHKRNSRVPEENRETAKAGLGYSESSDGYDVVGVGLKSLIRQRLQLSYPDLTARTEKATLSLLQEHEAVTAFSDKGRLLDDELQITCWRCMGGMWPDDKNVNPSCTCKCNSDRPPVASKAAWAYTPMYGNMIRGHKSKDFVLKDVP